MKKNMVVAFVFLPFLFSGCGKGSGLCEDMELSFKRQDHTGTQLRMDGYYYGDPIKSGNSEIYYLYRNGVYLGGFNEPFEKAINGTIEYDVINSLSNTKYVWGAFQLNGNMLEMEYWMPKMVECFKTLYMKGKIQNDTTFVITLMQYFKRRVELILRNREFAFKNFATIQMVIKNPPRWGDIIVAK